MFSATFASLVDENALIKKIPAGSPSRLLPYQRPCALQAAAFEPAHVLIPFTVQLIVARHLWATFCAASRAFAGLRRLNDPGIHDRKASGPCAMAGSKNGTSNACNLWEFTQLPRPFCLM
jgi:hypothetical protein